MYVREKKVRRGEKTYSYWQLVEGHRVDGKVRQRIVTHLGPLPDRQTASVVARSRGLICGADGCGEAGVAEQTGRALRQGRHAERQILLCVDHVQRFQAGEILAAVHLGAVEE
jgi:hypothetical protein